MDLFLRDLTDPETAKKTIEAQDGATPSNEPNKLADAVLPDDLISEEDLPAGNTGENRS